MSVAASTQPASVIGELWPYTACSSRSTAPPTPSSR